MTYRGHVKNGKIILDGVVDLPDGAAVSIKPVRRRPSSSTRRRNEPPTLYDRLKKFAGKAKGLPADASVNLDHYLYGLPKRKGLVTHRLHLL